MIRHRILLVASLLAFASCAGDDARPAVVEATELAGRLSGYIVHGASGGALVAIALPGGDVTHLREPRDANAIGASLTGVHAVSGPDREGRLAFIEDQISGDRERSRHRLMTIRIDGTEATRLFERVGSGMWAGSAAGRGEIGKALALAPVGGRVAFVSGLGAADLGAVPVGEIEIFDFATGERMPVSEAAHGDSLAWMPDGKRLLFVAPDAGGGESMVHVLDTDTGASRALSAGSSVVADTDGTHVWIGIGRYPRPVRWMRFHVETSAISRVHVRVDVHRMLAAVDGLLVYRGLPTPGTEVRVSKFGSRPQGTKLMALKVADSREMTFCTVVPYIDPRHPISFGQVAR
jgi:hypothetical protein